MLLSEAQWRIIQIHDNAKALIPTNLDGVSVITQVTGKKKEKMA